MGSTASSGPAHPSKLYVDAEGVRRGYYVYLHRARPSGDVFYVGKGHGRRAWEEKRRSDAWKETVAALAEGWDVEIVEEDLSELEAFNLEEELVEKHGGSFHFGGTLANRVPGGEHGLAVGVGVSLGPSYEAAMEAYYRVRRFKDLPRGDQEGVVGRLLDALAEPLAKLDDVIDEAFDEDEELEEVASDLETITGSHVDRAKGFLRHRISWTEYGIELEELVEDLEDDDLVQGEHAAVEAIRRQCLDVARRVLAQIDTGNRTEAEKAAAKARKRTL